MVRKYDSDHGGTINLMFLLIPLKRAVRSRQCLHLNRKHRRKISNNRRPAVSRVGRRVYLAAAGAEIHSAFVQRVDGHRIAQDVNVAVFLWQTAAQRFPLVAAGAAAEHAQLAIRDKVLRITFDRDDVDGLRLVCVDVNYESKIGRQDAADFFPVIARVVRTHDIPVLLHEQHLRTRRVHRDVVNAVTDFRPRVGNVRRIESTVDRLSGFAGVVGTEGSRCRDGDKDSVRVAGIENDRMQAHSARAGLPLRAGTVAAQAGEFLPTLAAVGRAKQGSIFDAGVNLIWIGERRFQVPHPLELPRMLGAVIPLMSGERIGGGVVGEFVARALRRTRRGRLSGGRSRLMPGLAAVVGALNDLPEPSARLRSVNAVGIGGRSFQVIHFPSGEMRAADVPLFALAVRRENECAFARTYENSHPAHTSLLILLLSFYSYSIHPDSFTPVSPL